MLAPFFWTSAPVESPIYVSTHDHPDSDLNKGTWESLGTESQDFSLGKIRGDKQSAALDGILTSVWSRCRVWMYWPTDSVSAPEDPVPLGLQVALQIALKIGLEGLWAFYLFKM